jgi:Amt family ammonium transporter
VGGMLGTILLGVFAAKAWNPAGADGLLNGNARFFINQVVAVALAGAWAFVFTYGVLWAIDLVTPVKVDAKVEEAGLDTELHGEEAYPA